MKDKVILNVKNLTQYFPKPKNPPESRFEPFLQNINLDVVEGEIFGIVGESGCGKSTLGRCIVGLYTAVEGEILYRGNNVLKMSPNEMRDFRKSVQIIFQNPRSALNMSMKIEELIKEAVTINYTDTDHVVRLVDTILNDMQIRQKRNDFPHRLSGGERRRAGLGRILAVEPELIIADEPVSSLDVSYKGFIIDLLMKYKRSKNATIIFISHDIHLINQICQRVAVMFLGRLVEVFDPKYYKEMKFHHPYTRDLFDAALYFKEEKDNVDHLFDQEFKDAETAEVKKLGCVYYDRCNLKNEFMCDALCRVETPELLKVNDKKWFSHTQKKSLKIDNQKIACHAIKQSNQPKQI